MRKMRKSTRKVRSTRRSTRRNTRRKNRFGMAGYFSASTPGYGYSNDVDQMRGVLGQSTEYVTLKNNKDRSHNVSYDKRNISLMLDPKDLPVKGTYKDFFGQQVPSTIGPRWNFMAQPGGKPMVAVGTPFSAYRS